MKLTGKIGIIFLAIVLLAQPVSFYFHYLGHDFDTESHQDITLSEASDGFCHFCHTYFNQHAELPDPAFTSSVYSVPPTENVVVSDYTNRQSSDATPRAPPAV